MTNESLPQLHYPYNLLLDVKGRTSLSFPGKLNADMQAGFQYVLSTLPQPEQQLIQLHYAEGRSLSEIAAMLVISPDAAKGLQTKALQKLRLPSRWGYIQYGIAGYLKQETTAQYNKGYQRGYWDGSRDAAGTDLPALSEQGDLNRPIEFLNLPSRVHNALFRCGYTRIGDLVSLEESNILRINNLGKKGIREVAHALMSHGIKHTVWYQFLL